MPKRGSLDPALKLISAVREQGCLWDKGHARYHDKEAKAQAWRDVCSVVEPNYEEADATDRHEMGLSLIRKWTNMRDAYRKTLRNANKQCRPYIYGDQLSFLDPMFVDLKKTKRERKEISHHPEVEVGDEDEQWENEVFVDINEDSEPAAKMMKLNSTENLDDSVVSILAGLIQKEEDDDRAFFKSITPAVKTLSNDTKLEFRVEVMKLLQRLKKSDAKKQSRQFKTEADDSEADSD